VKVATKEKVKEEQSWGGACTERTVLRDATKEKENMRTAQYEVPDDAREGWDQTWYLQAKQTHQSYIQANNRQQG
jgi:hypothetical protein